MFNATHECFSAPRFPALLVSKPSLRTMSALQGLDAHPARLAADALELADGGEGVLHVAKASVMDHEYQGGGTTGVFEILGLDHG